MGKGLRGGGGVGGKRGTGIEGGCCSGQEGQAREGGGSQGKSREWGGRTCYTCIGSHTSAGMASDLSDGFLLVLPTTPHRNIDHILHVINS